MADKDYLLWLQWFWNDSCGDDWPWPVMLQEVTHLKDILMESSANDFSCQK